MADATARRKPRDFQLSARRRIFTPTRVPQGASDSAVHFHAQMTSCLHELLHRAVLTRIDDVLIHAKGSDGFLDNLMRFL
ncbi:hypothetical protein PybrP1_002124 [[Pythium] brassicae (nom. inval.)]|nr:hypothetical protein PybrP1_002124 [[Pythium] brassicae (nom. inval.)]